MLSIAISIIKIDNSKVHSLFIEYQRLLVICVQKWEVMGSFLSHSWEEMLRGWRNIFKLSLFFENYCPRKTLLMTKV